MWWIMYNRISDFLYDIKLKLTILFGFYSFIFLRPWWFFLIFWIFYVKNQGLFYLTIIYNSILLNYYLKWFILVHFSISYELMHCLTSRRSRLCIDLPRHIGRGLQPLIEIMLGCWIIGSCELKLTVGK